MARPVLAMVLTLGMAAVAWGQAGVRCRDRDHLGAFETPARQRHMIVEHNIGYLPWGRGWEIGLFDLSDPLDPVMLSVVEIPAGLRDLDLVDGRLFAATRNGLAIVDVSDPSAPERLGLYPGDVWDVAVQGDRAYINLPYEFSDLTLLDISDPTRPHELLRWSTPNGLVSAEWRGDHIYATRNGGGIDILDVGEWWDPRLVGSVDVVDTGYQLWTDGEVAYMPARQLYAFDVSDPTNPALLSTSYAPSTYELIERDGLVFAIAFDTVEAFDMRDPAFPVRVGNWDIERFSWGLGFVGDVLLVGRPDAGTVLLDVSTPKLPPREVRLEGTENAPDIELSDSGVLAVSSGSDGVLFFDISNAWEPVTLGSVATPGLARDLAWSDSLVLVAEGPAGMSVIDASDPERPAVVGAYSNGERVVTIGAGEGVAFLGHQMGTGVDVVDITVPGEPVLLGTFDALSRPQEMELHGGLLFMAAGPAGMVIYDVADPVHPVRLGVVDTPNSVSQLCVDGDRALLADGSTGFHVVDIADPSAPRLIGSGKASGSVASVAGGDGLAATIGSSGRLELFDLADPSSPTPVGTYPARANSRVLLTGDVAITAGDYPEVMIVDTADCPPCAADFNGDGTVDTQDMLSFLNAWASGDQSADFDGNGSVNTRDVLAFLDAWGAGC